VTTPEKIKPFRINGSQKIYRFNLNFQEPKAPQQNGTVGKRFQTFYGRIRAMLNCAGLKDDLKSGIWAECTMTVTFLQRVIYKGR